MLGNASNVIRVYSTIWNVPVKSAREQGFVETILGRRLYTPDIMASNKMIKQAAERAAINAPLQGSAADIIKMAIIAG